MEKKLEILHKEIDLLQACIKKYDDRTLFGAKGVSYLNFRVGYNWKQIEVFTNIMNLTDELYANTSSVGNGVNDRTTYGAAAPRTFVMGVQYNIFAKR